jgi:SSS family solute:Na+ symporter
MTVFSSGVSMYAMGKLLQLLLGWDFNVSILLSAGIVLVYTYLGGLTSAIYNEVLQFFLIVAGFVPLVILGLRDVGGAHGLYNRLAGVAVDRGFESGALTNSWQYMANPSQNPMGVEWFGLVFGLGFVLSFGYWCTDFLVVQRAMAADSMNAARRTPLIAAFPKMFFPFLVILPGMLAIAATTHPAALPIHVRCTEAAQAGQPGGRSIADSWEGLVPPKIDEGTCQPVVGTDGRVQADYDLATPMMLMHYFPSGILGLGLCALLASFMSGMAGNTTAFNTVWTYDIYQAYINKHASDQHYLQMGRAATVFGVLISVGAAYVAQAFNNIMDLLQLVFAFVNAPLFATFMLGMFWKRTTGHGAFTGLLAGTIAAAAHHGLTLPAGAGAGVKGGFLGSVLHVYPSEMAQNFWTAIFAWSTCFVVTLLVSSLTAPRPEKELGGLVYSLTPRPKEDGVPLYKQPGPLAIVVLLLTVVLNVIFW